MGVVKIYLFKHKYYKRINSTYEEILRKYKQAFELLCKENRLPITEDFHSKEFVVEHLEELTELDSCIHITNKYLYHNEDALDWFLFDSEQEKDFIPWTVEKYTLMAKNSYTELKQEDFPYKKAFSNYSLYYRIRVLKECIHLNSIEEFLPLSIDKYLFIGRNSDKINEYIKYLQDFYILVVENKEAIEHVKPTKHDYYTFEDIVTIAESKELVQKINFQKITQIKNKYPRCWKFFSRERSIDDIPLNELFEFQELGSSYHSLSEHEQFLNNIRGYENVLSLFLGVSCGNLSAQISRLEIIGYNNALSYFRKEEFIQPYEFDLKNQYDEDLKCLILGSKFYGKDFTFSEKMTIHDFYEYRSTLDSLNLRFDDILNVALQNRHSICNFNLEKKGHFDISKEDLINCNLEETDLYEYIQHHKEEQELRNLAESIAKEFPKGFSSLYINVNWDDSSLNFIQMVIKDKAKIKQLNEQIIKEEEQRDKELQKKIKAEQQKREEEERRRGEQERERAKQNEIAYLRNCVSDWYTHRWNGTIKHKWFCDYYNYEDHKHIATPDMWDTWHFIWDFKNDPDATFPTTPTQHHQALDKAVNLVEDTLRDTFGNYYLSKLTLVCCTASTREKNERRFKPFAEKVCNDLGMENAYNHITITEDGNAKHEGGTGITTKRYDSWWFKDKYIILFDDVRTSGASLAKEKAKLESFRATVICAITLGQTTN